MASEATEQEKKEYEQELQRRLEILRSGIEAGTVQFVSEPGIIESLKAVQYAPDGSVDLTTVDALVRSAAGAITLMHDREELKQEIPLAEVQHAYFNLIDGNLGDFYRVMVENKTTPHQIASYLSKKEGAVKELNERLPDFLAFIEEFWTNAADAVEAHVQDMTGTLRGTYGGDLFPLNTENIASKCGFYLDTIVLPDPFLRSKLVFQSVPPERKAYYLIKHSLNLLQYRDLACADTTHPIVAILPGSFDLDAEEKHVFSEMGTRDSLIHASKIFGRNFESLEELMDFAAPLNSIEKVENAVVDPSRVLFDADVDRSLREQIERELKTSDVIIKQSNYSIGQRVAIEAIGRMGISNELLAKSRRLGGLPIIDAATSWQYFVWKLEYDAAKIEREVNIPHLHVVRGLQKLAENKMEWLGKVPPQALIELRKQGAIEEIRHILSKGISDLSSADAFNFQTTTEEVFKNIENAFTEHRKALYELEQKKYQFAGTTIASWVAVGSLAVTAAVSPPLLRVLAGVAGSLISPPKPREIKETNRKFSEEQKAIEKLPVGMLFKYADSR